MKKANLVLGIISLAVAIVLFFLGINTYGFEMGNTTVRLYPSAFFALLAAVLVFRYLVPKRSKSEE